MIIYPGRAAHNMRQAAAQIVPESLATELYRVCPLGNPAAEAWWSAVLSAILGKTVTWTAKTDGFWITIVEEPL